MSNSNPTSKDSEDIRMKMLSLDTHHKAEKFLIELIRKAPAYRRLQMVTSLVKTTRQLSWQGISDRYSKETQKELIQRFISLLYGDKLLAERFTDLLVKRGIL